MLAIKRTAHFGSRDFCASIRRESWPGGPSRRRKRIWGAGQSGHEACALARHGRPCTGLRHLRVGNDDTYAATTDSQ